MKHITLLVDDVPAAPLVIERRRTPDRRAVWRGGRRESDWVNRPSGLWDGSKGIRQPRRWRGLVSYLNTLLLIRAG